MSTTLQTTQIILGTAAALLILGVIATALFYVASSILEKWYAKGQQDQWNTDMRRLRDWSCWFGEDEPTQNLIENLSRDGDVSAIREKWNRDRASQPRPTATN